MDRSRLSILVLLITAACSTGSTLPHTSSTPPKPTERSSPAATLCSIADDRITEASGLVASSRHDDMFFVHNDSGDQARFFAINNTCQTVGTYTLRGVRAIDWEDIARGPGPNGRSVLWLGDIGDNLAQRSSITAHRVAEPDPSTSATSIDATTFVLTYPDGPHDAETLLADPLDGRLYVVTKNALGPSDIYAAELPLTSISMLRKVNSVNVAWTTGGDISPDGTRLVLRNYLSAFIFDLRAASAARLSQPLTVSETISLPVQRQGEAVSWSRNGRQLVTTSEGSHQSVQLVTP